MMPTLFAQQKVAKTCQDRLSPQVVKTDFHFICRLVHCVFVEMCIYDYMHVYDNMHICVHIYKYILCIDVYMHVHMCMYANEYAYVYVCTCMIKTRYLVNLYTELSRPHPNFWFSREILPSLGLQI